MALAEDVKQHLAAHVGEFPGDLLFPPTRGGKGFMSDTPFYTAWNAARDAAGLRIAITNPVTGKITGHESPVREHDLRHFYGSALAENGAGIAQLQRALRHGSARASLMYLHAAQELDTKLADSLPLPTSLKRVVRIG